MDKNIKYGIDQASPNGDKTGLAIMVGKKLYSFVGEEAEVIIELIAQETKIAEVRGRIDELKYFEPYTRMWKKTKGLPDERPVMQTVEERITELQAGRE